MITLNEFIINLKLTKAFTSKQLIVIDFISIYINDSKVYKVVIAVNPSMMKKAKKLNINVPYKTIYFDDYEIDLKSKELKNKCNKGRYIIMYYPNNEKTEISVYEGEEDELTQVKRLKHSPTNALARLCPSDFADFRALDS